MCAHVCHHIHRPMFLLHCTLTHSLTTEVWFFFQPMVGKLTKIKMMEKFLLVNTVFILQDCTAVFLYFPPFCSTCLYPLWLRNHLLYILYIARRGLSLTVHARWCCVPIHPVRVFLFTPWKHMFWSCICIKTLESKEVDKYGPPCCASFIPADHVKGSSVSWWCGCHGVCEYSGAYLSSNWSCLNVHNANFVYTFALLQPNSWNTIMRSCCVEWSVIF